MIKSDFEVCGGGVWKGHKREFSGEAKLSSYFGL